jgi:GrpB-like predicted nucleotidyltransferase (UPF0157 family)
MMAVESSGEVYADRLERVTIGPLERLSGPIELTEYDPRWPEAYEREAARIREALGGRALRVEHVGSTSVPGLLAKPIIDVVIEVADSSAEPAYRPAIEAAGYTLRIREPNWFNHRLFKDLEGFVNLHGFSSGCPETDRMVMFRELLRNNPADRERYARAKRELAARSWTYVQQYADAKSDVIASIIAKGQPAPRARSQPS